MLETVREYATAMLDADDDLSGTVRLAHAEHFVDLADARRRDLHGPARREALDALAAELDNLQAAWRHLLDRGDVARLNRLLDPLWMLHESRGWYHSAVAVTTDLLGALERAGTSPGDIDDEIALRMSLGRGLLALRGYTEEVEQVYRDALALADRAGVAASQFPVLRSLASFHLAKGEIDRVAAIGQQVLELAQEASDASLELEGHLLLGPALALFGDAPGGIAHLDRAIELFDPARHRPRRLRFGPNPGVTAAALSAIFSWVFGYPDTSARRAALALRLASELNHPYSTAYANFHVARVDLWNRDHPAALARAHDVIAVAEQHDYAIWRAVGLVVRGVSTAWLGRPAEGLDDTARGIALYEGITTPPVFWPQVLSLKAETCALAGRLDEALASLDQAATLAGTVESLDTVSLRMQRAEVLLHAGDAGSAASFARAAYDVAGSIGLRMIRLRAATLLATLERDGPNGDGAGAAALREVYETFTEGFDAPDLRRARSLIEASSTISPR
ncbi:MAG: hypothetical protein M3295_07725 [Chloroflexota bacterium]|nr:hypothetical protein [Chloroflexota bacterium]